jgi:hypothetical protein
MPFSNSEPSDFLDHGELISVLTELYTLLDTLSAMPSTIAALPPSDTGVHPPSDFDADGALAAFSLCVYCLLGTVRSSVRCYNLDTQILFQYP